MPPVLLQAPLIRLPRHADRENALTKAEVAGHARQNGTMSRIRSTVVGALAALGIVAASAIAVQATTIRDEPGVEQPMSAVLVPQAPAGSESQAPVAAQTTPAGPTAPAGSGTPTSEVPSQPIPVAPAPPAPLDDDVDEADDDDLDDIDDPEVDEPDDD